MVLERQPDYFLLMKSNGEIIYASQSASQHLGYSPQEILKLKLYNIYTPLPPPQMLLIRQNLHQESILRLYRIHHLDKTGTWRPVQVKLFSFKLDNQICSCLVARRTAIAA